MPPRPIETNCSFVHYLSDLTSTPTPPNTTTMDIKREGGLGTAGNDDDDVVQTHPTTTVLSNFTTAP